MLEELRELGEELRESDDVEDDVEDDLEEEEPDELAELGGDRDVTVRLEWDEVRLAVSSVATSLFAVIDGLSLWD